MRIGNVITPTARPALGLRTDAALHLQPLSKYRCRKSRGIKPRGFGEQMKRQPYLCAIE